MKIIRIAQEQQSQEQEQSQEQNTYQIREQILTTIFDSLDGRKYDDPDITKAHVEKQIQELMGTAYLDVSYAHWDNIIIVQKYYENEIADQEYGKTYKINMDYDNPEKTIQEAQKAIKILEN